VDFLAKRGLAINDISVEDHPLKDDDVFNMEQILYFMKIEGMIKEKLKLNDSSDVVFQLDIESAMRYSLVHEISSRKFIAGDAMMALKNYLYVLSKHFPISKSGVKFLKGIYESISSKSEITGSEFESIVLAKEKEYDPVFLKPQGWLGCRGSQPQFRGYPCGLWTMFHTLTVHSEANSHRNISTDPQEVLLAIVGYVKNFFGCSHCAKHFLQMSTTMRGNVSSFDDSILWLWKAHNSANQRLAGDETEDPTHPKVQFPTDKMCPNCTSQNGSYNEQAVLEFLKGMYHNISFMLLTDLPSTPKPSPTPAASDLNEMSSYNKLVYHQDFSVKEKDYVFTKSISSGSGFNFNIFDVSLCVILYICSTGIILLVCVKIFIKRTYRKKPYAYDIFHKV
jgi:thiol oxidase